MKSIKIERDDPTIILAWNAANMEPFIAAANQPRLANQPAWLTGGAQITTQSFQMDVVAFLSIINGDKNFQGTVIGPNTQQQYLRIAGEMYRLEADPFVQECMVAALLVNRPLATAVYITDGKTQATTPFLRVAVGGNELVFA